MLVVEVASRSVARVKSSEASKAKEERKLALKAEQAAGEACETSSYKINELIVFNLFF